MVGKYELASERYWEIALPDDYNAYGHFTMDHEGNLVCDGYFKYPWEIKAVRENSTDNGPDPHKKDGEYISKVIPNWNDGSLTWFRSVNIKATGWDRMPIHIQFTVIEETACFLTAAAEKQ